LGILNSKLGWFLISHYCTQIQNGYQLIFKYLQAISIRTIDFGNPTDKTTHDKIVQLVEQILKLNKQLSAHNDPQTQTILERRIKAIDKQIDQLVYRLYDLTAEEIEIAERNSIRV
ncbi:MAG: restriction endonuclease subunit R, partial [Gammaproteobacteria bacterium]